MLEMVVYITLLSFFMIITVNAALIMTSSYSKALSARLLDSSINLTISKIEREAKNSISINDSLSTFNQNPGRISFFTQEGSVLVPVEFFVENGTLKMKRGGVLIGAITLPGVSVDSVVFNKIDSSGKQGFRMSITLTADKAGRTKTENFYYSASLRGSY